MLDIGRRDGPRPKLNFTHSILPAFVDHEHPSQKRKLFSTIQEYPHIHTASTPRVNLDSVLTAPQLNVHLPNDACDNFLANLNGKGSVQYAKVYMKLSDIVEGDFFKYIKTGNILMRSEGRPRIDKIFSVHEGILRLELDKATYERTGLSGTPIPHEGRKHIKVRYAVDINLRLPSMVRGKHGFERILWALKNVLNSRVAWLFYDLEGANDGSGPIAAHQPIIKTVEPQVEALGQILVPSFPDEIEANDQDTPAELVEWLSLTMSQSPRVQKGDQIDSYLSRYCIPSTEDGEASDAQQLAKVRWHGFIPADFVQNVTIAALKASKDEWFAVSCRAFDSKTHTFQQHKQNTFTWEFED